MLICKVVTSKVHFSFTYPPKNILMQNVVDVSHNNNPKEIPLNLQIPVYIHFEDNVHHLYMGSSLTVGVNMLCIYF